jgi:hypothetical protein
MGAVTMWNATSAGSSTLNITNSHFAGIQGPVFQIFEGAHNVTFSNSTVHGIQFESSVGVEVGAGNAIVSMNNVTFTGHFGSTIVRISGANTVLSGSGNTLNATFGSSFCSVTGSATGTFNFTAPAGTCP